MSLYLLFLSLFIEPDIRRLNSPVWSVRESAQSRLRACWWAALPQLTAGSQAEDAETAHRCRELLARSRVWEMRLRAMTALVGAEWPDADAFWRDEMLRRYTHKLARELCRDEADAWYVARLLPEGDVWGGWWGGWRDPIEETARAMEACRKRAGAPPPRAPQPRTVER